MLGAMPSRIARVAKWGVQNRTVETAVVLGRSAATETTRRSRAVGPEPLAHTVRTASNAWYSNSFCGAIHSPTDTGRTGPYNISARSWEVVKVFPAPVGSDISPTNGPSAPPRLCRTP